MSGSQSVSQYHTQPQPSSYPSNVGSAKLFSFGLGLQTLTPTLTRTRTPTPTPTQVAEDLAEQVELVSTLQLDYDYISDDEDAPREKVLAD